MTENGIKISSFSAQFQSSFCLKYSSKFKLIFLRNMALKGLRVIEMAGLAPSPVCGMILSDFGASVTRIDKVNERILCIIEVIFMICLILSTGG